MKPVFLDTVGLLALWDESDQWHQAAKQSFELMLELKVDFLTTTYVLAECGNAAARRPYRSAVYRLKEQLESAGMLESPTPEDWADAWTSYNQGEADNAGIVDQLSISVARRLGLTQIFTNDRHFRAAGFEVLF